MKIYLNPATFFLFSLWFWTFSFFHPYALTAQEHSARLVLERTLGPAHATRFILQRSKQLGPETYKLHVSGNRIIVQAGSPTALTRGAYDYLRQTGQGIVSWSGKRIEIPEKLTAYKTEATSPFPYRYYFNTVTHGYSTAYWGWERWEEEIDWMALHGLNMPLIGGAHEAILLRVFRKLGLTEEEALDYISGPAYFPWNRMGNIGGWDGPPPRSFFDKQVALAHKVQDRMRELDMTPIVHAFAGFVPEGIQRLFPEEVLREVSWGGFEKNVLILSPTSPLFYRIGKMYIEEWEKEFGKGAFYLADSFNEMDVPLSSDPEKQKEELAAYGKAVYAPIAAANPDAVWVMQGWTFPYHRDKDGNLFWTPERLKALISGIPDDKLLILDMANEYNALFWKIPHSWQMYQGFFGKPWIYSFIPNMGGKVPLNGVLEFYAKAPAEALEYPDKGKLVGFGFAPEGIENNEIVYELLSDWAWRKDPIDLNNWMKSYCNARYGGYPTSLQRAYDLLLESALGSFTDHPRFRYQFRPGEDHQATVHRSPVFEKAAVAFLEAGKDLPQSELYTYDAIEIGTQLIGLKIDSLLFLAENTEAESERHALYQRAIGLMRDLDPILDAT